MTQPRKQREVKKAFTQIPPSDDDISDAESENFNRNVEENESDYFSEKKSE